MEELKAKMERSSAALAQFEKDLSVINPDEKTSILSARLLQLNTEFTTAQGDRVRKQAAYDSVKRRLAGGSPGLHPGRAAPQTGRPPGRSAREVRGREDAIWRRTTRSTPKRSPR